MVEAVGYYVGVQGSGGVGSRLGRKGVRVASVAFNSSLQELHMSFCWERQVLMLCLKVWVDCFALSVALRV